MLIRSFICIYIRYAVKPCHDVTDIVDFEENFYFGFSNSLIIHQVKTKKITTVKEVLIPGLN